MSLNIKQREATIRELKENFDLLSLSIDTIAKDLKTNKEKIKAIFNLNISQLEEVWILKEYMNNILLSQNKIPIEYSALKGDYHDYWFLNKNKIENLDLN